jgi:hypothetical protein
MFRLMHTLLVLSALLINNACHPGAADITIVSSGKPGHVIVVPATATKNETKAALVLQDYIRRISGAKPDIISESTYQEQAAIFIGNTTHGEQYNSRKIIGEGFYIATDNKQLYIHGGSGQGVVYGVYSFIEKYLGCRKYANVPSYTPDTKTIHIPANVFDLQNPQFIYRQVYYPAATDPEYLAWHKLQQFEDLWGIWGHSFFKIIPPATYFASHPEYYSLVNGKRQPMQLCLSNEAVFQLTIDYLKKAISNNPDAIYWSIAPMDGGGFCTCDNCKKIDAAAGGPQGSLINFVNRVANQFPQQKFTTLAYTYTSHPPKNITPAENVFIMLSSIDAYREEPLRVAPSAAGFRKDLEGWAALTSNIFIWDYTTQFTNYLAPFPDYNNLQDNLQYFVSHQVKGVFSQGSGETYSDMAALNSYLLANLLWDVNQDSKTLTTGFLNGFYGKAGTWVATYLQELINAVKTTKSKLDIYGNPVSDYKGYLSPALIDKYSQSLDKAEALAETDTILLNRVYNARLPIEYTVLQQSRFFGNEQYGYLTEAEGSYIVKPNWPARVKRFVAQCKKAGVTELSEDGITPDIYGAAWEALFAKKWINNLAFHAKVTLAYPFTPEYTPKGAQTLVDGLTGDTDFSYNWLFTYGQDLIATIDMEKSKTVNEVQLNFLQDPRHNIFNPTQISIETSADGITFQQAGSQSVPPLMEEDNTAKVNTWQFKLPSVHVRYIRVTAKCLPAMPVWRNAAGKKPALCCDEIYVL